MVGVLALLTAGCIRSTSTLVVHDDGSGTGDVVIAVDPEALSAQADQTAGFLAAQVAAADAEQICTLFVEAAVPAALPPTATINNYDEDGFCGRRIQFTFADEAGLISALTTLGGDQAATANDIVLRQEQGDWIFEAPLVGVTGAIEDVADSFSLPQPLLSAALGQADVTYVVTLPGEAVDGAHNADAVDGGTFTWNVDLTDPPEQLLARTSPSAGGGSLLPLILLAVVVTALAGAAGLVVVNRNRQATPTPVQTGPGAATEQSSPSTTAWTQTAPPASVSSPQPTRSQGPASGPNPAEPVAAEPRWDDERQAWVADHPVEGLLVHDDDSSTWRRAD